MRFIETLIFTEEISHLLEDEEYRALQLALLFRPDAGPVIPGGNGIRKLRWRLRSKGKRGGLRVIYYWDKPDDTIYMLWVYRKSQQEDLTTQQARLLSKLVKAYLS